MIAAGDPEDDELDDGEVARRRMAAAISAVSPGTGIPIVSIAISAKIAA